MGGTERHIFEVLLISGASLWVVATVFTTRRFVEAFFYARHLRATVPFVTVSTILGISHVIVAMLYVAAIYFNHNVALLRVTVYAIPVSTIIWAMCFIYLGHAIRRANRPT